MAQTDDPDVTETEQAALHELQLAMEHVNRSFGHLIAFHHAVGRGMDRMAEAEDLLREAGHAEFADELRTEHLPRGIVGDRWTYEVVESFEGEFLAAVEDYERRVREDLADGVTHITERDQQRRWRRHWDR